MARKKRTPIRHDVAADASSTLVLSVAPPTPWRHRDTFRALESHWGTAGRLTAALDEVFGVDWLLQQHDVAHEVARAMYWSFEECFRLLADVADLVLSVQKCASGAAEVTGRLEVHEEYDGAMFEARTARLLQESGLRVGFNNNAGSSFHYDIDVFGEVEFCVEVKSLRASRKTCREYALAEQLMRPWMTTELKVHVEFDWNRKALASRSKKTSLYAIASELAPQMRQALCQEGTFELGRLGAVTVTQCPENERGCNLTHGPDLDSSDFRKKLTEAAKQLPPNMPGVVFLCAQAGDVDLEASASVIDRFFRTRGARNRHVAGAVLLTTSTSLTEVRETTAGFENPASSWNFSDLPIAPLHGTHQKTRWRMRHE